MNDEAMARFGPQHSGKTKCRAI